jgi:hypothetical protein
MWPRKSPMPAPREEEERGRFLDGKITPGEIDESLGELEGAQFSVMDAPRSDDFARPIRVGYRIHEDAREAHVRSAIGDAVIVIYEGLCEDDGEFGSERAITRTRPHGDAERFHPDSLSTWSAE